MLYRSPNMFLTEIYYSHTNCILSKAVRNFKRSNGRFGTDAKDANIVLPTNTINNAAISTCKNISARYSMDIWRTTQGSCLPSL